MIYTVYSVYLYKQPFIEVNHILYSVYTVYLYTQPVIAVNHNIYWIYCTVYLYTQSFIEVNHIFQPGLYWFFEALVLMVFCCAKKYLQFPF